MIVVIADDLTGAAELGGLGLRYGLTVEIVTTVDQPSNAELLIVATDSRSMPEAEALKIMAYITTRLKRFNIDLLFKKVDSVLRGHVVAELRVHLQELNLKRALLVPANPVFGRTIANGHYYIDHTPVHLTGFAKDPEFAITSSAIHDILRVKEQEIYLQHCEEPLAETGIIAGECGSEADLLSWAQKADHDTLMAGGSGLFKAILTSLNLQPVDQAAVKQVKPGHPALFVCGSTFNKSKQLVEEINNNNGPVSYMPQGIVDMENPPEKLFEQWAEEIYNLLLSHKKAIIAIDETSTPDAKKISGSLREKKAKVVEKTMERIALKELFVEGGATAAAIMKRLSLNKFYPVNEFSTGVIRMKAGDKKGLFLTFKPGSYEWPPHIWNF